MLENKPQNLIIFCSDEHARRVTRCYGDPVVKTPTLDTIARLGTRFTSAYTPVANLRAGAGVPAHGATGPRDAVLVFRRAVSRAA
jgi:hypothetical protein